MESHARLRGLAKVSAWIDSTWVGGRPKWQQVLVYMVFGAVVWLIVVALIRLL